MLSYPSDEVGNHLISMDRLDEKGIDPWTDVLSLERFRAEFGSVIHPFTGVDYVEYYSSRRRGRSDFCQPRADHSGLHRYRHHL